MVQASGDVPVVAKEEAAAPAKVELTKVSSKVTLKTKPRIAGLKVRKVRSKLMLSVPSAPDSSERYFTVLWLNNCLLAWKFLCNESRNI